MTTPYLSLDHYRLDGPLLPEIDPFLFSGEGLSPPRPLLGTLVEPAVGALLRKRSWVKHPALLPLIDVLRLDDPTMAQLDKADGLVGDLALFARPSGVTLQSLVTPLKPLPVRSTVESFLWALEGVSELHRVGVPHGAITPWSLWFEGEQRQRLLLGVGGPSTAAYAFRSPDRIRSQTPSEGDDLWAFMGCLYFAVRGRPPYEAESQAALLRRILGGRPLISPGEGPVNSALTALFQRAFSFREAERFSEATQVRDELTSLLASCSDEPPPAAPEPPAGALAKTPRRMVVPAPRPTPTVEQAGPHEGDRPTFNAGDIQPPPEAFAPASMPQGLTDGSPTSMRARRRPPRAQAPLFSLDSPVPSGVLAVPHEPSPTPPPAESPASADASAHAEDLSAALERALPTQPAAAAQEQNSPTPESPPTGETPESEAASSTALALQPSSTIRSSEPSSPPLGGATLSVAPLQPGVPPDASLPAVLEWPAGRAPTGSPWSNGAVILAALVAGGALVLGALLLKKETASESGSGGALPASVALTPEAPTVRQIAKASAEASASVAPSISPPPRRLSLDACMRGSLLPGAISPDASLDFVCSAGSPRKIQVGLQRVIVVAGRGGPTSDAMREWSSLGWYQQMAVVALRARCCPGAPPIEMATKPCKSSETMAAVARAATEESALDDAVLGARQLAFCLDDNKLAGQFEQSAPPSPGEEAAFRAFLRRRP